MIGATLKPWHSRAMRVVVESVDDVRGVYSDVNKALRKPTFELLLAYVRSTSSIASRVVGSRSQLKYIQSRQRGRG